jgi:hypothetical protein
MIDHGKQNEKAKNGAWVKYGHLHFYSTLFGFFLQGAPLAFFI